jgi:cytochrome c oxidase subunit 2
MLVTLCTYAAIVLKDIEEAPASGQEARVGVTGEQFTWTFEYTGPDGKKFSTNQLYVEQGKSVKFDVKSKDVLHDFWVPQWRMKIDAVPGITTTYRVTPTKTGVFPVVCAELCGLGHAFMRQNAHVLSPDAFAKWMSSMSSKKAAGAAPAAGGKETASADGKTHFTDGNGDSIACGSCHTLADAGTSSQTGPELDKVLAGKDPAFIKESIIDPNADIAEGFAEGLMPPNYGETLTPAEIDALVTYLADATKK